MSVIQTRILDRSKQKKKRSAVYRNYLERKTELVAVRESFYGCLGDGNANRRRWRRENGGRFGAEMILVETLTLTVRTCPYSMAAITDGRSLQRRMERSSEEMARAYILVFGVCDSEERTEGNHAKTLARPRRRVFPSLHFYK